MSASPNPWFVYILECENGKLYTGITVDLARRFDQHASGRGATFTRINKPRRLLAVKPCVDRSEASRLEASVKRLSRPKKERLCHAWRKDAASTKDPALARLLQEKLPW